MYPLSMSDRARFGVCPEPTLKLQFADGHRRQVELNRFVRFEADSNYTNCIFQDGSRLLVSITLGQLLTRISPTEYIRIHSKHAINRQYVAGVIPGKQVVRLITGEDVVIARRRMREILAELPALSFD
ncbi:MAG: LytTR family transcriptional regulator [Cytophagales bacterium]|nr:MAG: LytTR family transcriptional regulator [Cytophagales bacterium]